MRDTLKLALFLMFVAAVAGLGVGYVNILAEPLIEKQILQNKIDSFREVYPKSDKVENETARYLTDKNEQGIKEVNIAYLNNSAAGVIYLVETKGYSGPITILAGFDIASRRLTAIKILNQTETPGLGAKSKEPFFYARFKNKNAATPLEITKKVPVKEQEVQAITASTITSKAIIKGVNLARQHFIMAFTEP